MPEGSCSIIPKNNHRNFVAKIAYETFPQLKQQKVIGSWAGLRPYRPTVKLEKEDNIIHNYSHGGTGFTLAFGCAKEVINLLQQ